VLHNSVVVSEYAEGKRERRVEGLMETLVRGGGSWKFLTLTSFDHAPE
jgi:hypothetical protein